MVKYSKGVRVLILLVGLVSFISCNSDSKDEIEEDEGIKVEQENKNNDVSEKYIGDWSLISSKSSIGTEPFQRVNPFFCEEFKGLTMTKDNYVLKIIKPNVNQEGVVGRERCGAKETLSGSIEMKDDKFVLFDSSILDSFKFSSEDDKIIITDSRGSRVTFTHTFEKK